MKPYYDEDGITIYHGDCREVLPTLDHGIAGAFVMDPPYGTRQERDGYGRRQNYGGVGRHIANDDGLEVLGFVMGEACRLIVRDGWAATFCSPKRHTESAKICCESGFPVQGEAVWDKVQPGLGGGIRYQHETILLCHRGNAAGRAPMLSVLRGMSGRENRGEKHPHEKPFDVMAALVKYTTRERELVIDPCSGSGSTLVAAKLLGRRAVGIETEERWCEDAANRLRQGVLFAAGGAA